MTYLDSAEDALRKVNRAVRDDAPDGAKIMAASAQALAAMAVAEEQRTANLIAYAMSGSVTPARRLALMDEVAGRMGMDR